MVFVTFDPESKAIYFKLEEHDKRRVAKTIPIGGDRFMDVDESGKAIGFEIILPRNVPQEAVEAIVNSKDAITVLN